jgi:hypothetical protein
MALCESAEIMSEVCPIDWNVIYCWLHYEPGLLLILCLAMVCLTLAVKSTNN